MKVLPVHTFPLTRCSIRTSTIPISFLRMSHRSQSTLSSYIVTPSQLSAGLQKNSNIIPVCASWFLPNDPQKRTGLQVFQSQRIPRARFFDLDAVKDHDSAYPHMLPTAEEFAKAMEKMGIKREDELVVYDSKELGIFSAPRVAWTFKVFGHRHIHLLNNFRLWVEQGFPTESGEVGETTEGQPGSYPVPDVNPDNVASFAQVKDIVRRHGTEDADEVQILDARSSGRWAGTAPEPRPGMLGGHMPGSLSVPISELLHPESGALLPGEELRKIFTEKGVDPKKPIISSCGTGVTAAVVDVALAEADYGPKDDRRIYDGSWTEWAMRVAEKSPEEKEKLIHKVT